MFILLTALFTNSSINYVLSKENVKNHVLDSLNLMADLTKNDILSFDEHLKNRAIDFSSDGFIRDSATAIIKQKNHGVTEHLSSHLLLNKLPLDPTIYGINVADLSGRVIASTDQEEIGKDESNHEYFIWGKNLSYGEAYVGDVIPGHHFQKTSPEIAVTSPLTDKISGEKIGVIINYVEAKYLSDVVKARERRQISGESSYISLERTKTFETVLINKDKLLLAESKFKSGDLVLKEKIETLPPEKCAEGETVTGLFDDYRGEKVVGVSRCLEHGWTLVIKIDRTEAFNDLIQILNYTILAGIILSLLFLFIINASIDGILRPLQKLFLVAQKIGKGDLNQRVKITAKNEIGEFAAVFNQMVASLQSIYATLDKKIKEKTRALENQVIDLKKFQMAVADASDHIIITDPEGIILYANAAAEKITGYPEKEMLGKKPSLWGKQMSKEFYQKMWKTIKTDKKIFIGELTNKKKNGEKYIAEAHISPILDSRGKIIFFVGIERDITKAKEIDRAKTELISLASHQLRTPLTAVKWYAEMLAAQKAGKLMPKQKKYLDEIYRGNERMITLVSALLNVSRIELGTFAINPEPEDITKIAENALLDLRPQIKNKKIFLKKEYDPALPKINVDAKLLRIVFQNILSNAVKYTGKNGKIDLSISKQKTDVLIKVSDSGIGIPKEDQSKIFTKLFRTDNAKIADPNGTGLGLYIVKSIIDASGGKIWFSSPGESASGGESKKNKGTTFYVTLPLQGVKRKPGTAGLELVV